MAEAADIRACRAVIQRHARSFSFASRFLAPRLRDDVAVVYAYYRQLDDLVDDTPAGVSPMEVAVRLDRWERWVCGGMPADDGADPVRRALPDVVARRELPVEELALVIRGQRTDLRHRRPETMADVERYAHDVAGSVGIVMATLLGAGDPRAHVHAANLGTAMQLTNICRDVAEDLDRDRIYLPREVCAAVGCDDVMLRRRAATREVRAAVRTVAERAEMLYADGLAGLDYLPLENRFPIAVAARAYGAILERLAARDHDVFSGRVALRGRQRWALAARLYAARARQRRGVARV